MSHIHIPDGVLPVYLWVLGYVLTFGIIFILQNKIKHEDMRKKVPFTGVVAAIMLIAMTIPLGIVPLHLSLAVLCGILVGPKLGFLAVFVVNIILALFGHGGITVVGVNTLVIGSEVLVGFYVFKFLSNKISKVWSSVFAVCLALLVSTTFMVAVVGTTIGLQEALPHHHHEEKDGKIQGADQGYEQEHSDFEKVLAEVHYLSLTGWSAVALILSAGIALEAFITALIVRFFLKRRPDFIVINHVT
jgi:cobalt/nickel transport system permease protein